ncbi:hypothetical protein J6590_068405 [Homalodisca vitripennis]|nr:hypothetical protein J6590_068405 [Homalodisca vitripennis]
MFVVTAGGGDKGLVMAWHQKSQMLAVGGDSRIIRLWDAERELRVCDLSSGADYAATCLDCDQSAGSLLAAGYADGAVRLYDRRLPPNEAKVYTYREHAQGVTYVNLRDGSSSHATYRRVALPGILLQWEWQLLLIGQTLSSGRGPAPFTKSLTGAPVKASSQLVRSVRGAGDVRVIDTRKHSTAVSCQTSQGMTSMAAHRLADIFASGSMHQYIGLYSLNGTALNVIKYHE